MLTVNKNELEQIFKFGDALYPDRRHASLRFYKKSGKSDNETGLFRLEPVPYDKLLGIKSAFLNKHNIISEYCGGRESRCGEAVTGIVANSTFQNNMVADLVRENWNLEIISDMFTLSETPNGLVQIEGLDGELKLQMDELRALGMLGTKLNLMLSWLGDGEYWVRLAYESPDTGEVVPLHRDYIPFEKETIQKTIQPIKEVLEVKAGIE